MRERATRNESTKNRLKTLFKLPVDSGEAPPRTRGERLRQGGKQGNHPSEQGGPEEISPRTGAPARGDRSSQAREE